MIYYLYKSTDANRQYIVDSEVTMENFFVFVENVSKSFGVKPNFTSVPEAEFATIVLIQGKIFLKYDLVDGLEVSGVGLLKEHFIQIENLLSTC